MNFQFKKLKSHELGLVIIKKATLVQSCVLPKPSEINFQFKKEKKVENELGVVGMVRAAFIQSCVLKKFAAQKLLRISTDDNLDCV